MIENNEEIEAIHAEATAPKSDFELASDLNIESINPDDVTRSVLIKALEIRGITKDTLNVSLSKFNKLNKEQIITILKSHNRGEAKESKSEAKESAPAFDIFGSILEIKDEIIKAKKSGDFSRLDSAVADKMLKSASNDNTLSNINIDNGYITKTVLGLGALYLTARLIGFDVISEKINKVRNKNIKVQNEQPTNQQDS